ncbi:MAG: InlB B-repeat-containing protein [Bacteroidales bacterium]|nr:InlB B-repeat-containing protein [Bacteroidales bacterium]
MKRLSLILTYWLLGLLIAMAQGNYGRADDLNLSNLQSSILSLDGSQTDEVKKAIIAGGVSGPSNDDDFNPSSPGDPSPNTWDAASGTVIILKNSSFGLRTAIQSLVGSQTDKVKKIVVGDVDLIDFSVATYFPNCTELDMRYSSLSTTDRSAYENNNTLKHVYLPKTMKSMGSYAFRNCTSLESITCLATTPPSCSSSTFQGISSSAKLYVPAKSIAAYLASNWKVMDVYPLPGEKAMFAVSYIVDGKLVAVDSVEYRSTNIATLKAPEKEGHTFVKWLGVPATMPARNVVVSAEYEPNKYQITYLLDGEVYAQDSVLYASAIAAPKNPAKEGHTFVAWVAADNQQLPNTMPAHDLVMSAVFTTNVYQVTYMLDGEVFKTDSVVYAAPVIAPEVPVKEYYTFGGWQNVPETMPASDVTIEGSYIANKYMIIYLLDDEVFAIDSVAYKSEIVTLEAPEKEGYTFNGWENVPDSMPAQDVTIMGSYRINTYRLVYLVDDAIYYQDSLVYGTPIILIEEPVREGYDFSGWSEAPATMPAYDLTISGSFTVGLDAPMLNHSKCDVYSMDGKLLHRAISVEDLRKTLQPGFYIVGDRKIVIK